MQRKSEETLVVSERTRPLGSRGARARAAAVGAALVITVGCGTTTAPVPSGTSPIAARPSGDRLEVRREAGRVTVRIRPAAKPAGETLQLVAGATFNVGARADSIDAVLVGFRRVGARFRFAACRVMGLTADGALVGTTPLRREAQIGGKQLHELVYTLVPISVARALAAARSVSIELCGARYPLVESEHQQLRRFVARLRATLGTVRDTSADAQLASRPSR